MSNAPPAHPGQDAAYRLRRDASVVQRFGLGRKFLTKMRHFAATHNALQQSGQPSCARQQMLRERLAYRRHDLGPFHALVRHSEGLDSVPSTQPVASRCSTPCEVALLWCLGDVAHTAGNIKSAERRWWAASTDGGQRPLAWQNKLLRFLNVSARSLRHSPALRALSQLHIEQIQVGREPMRWGTSSHWESLSAALELSPNLYLARFMMAANFYIQKNLPRAEELFIHATIDMQGHSFGSFPTIFWKLGDHVTASLRHRQWEWLAQIRPHEPLFAYAATVAATAAGDHRSALAHEHHILSHLPRCAYGPQARAETLFHLGDFPGARSALITAIGLGLTHSTAHRALAALDARAGNAVAAQQRFDAIVRGASNPADAHIKNAMICMRLGCYTVALDEFSQAIELGPVKLTALLDAASCLCLTGRYKEARLMLLRARQQIRSRAANSAQYLLILGTLFAKSGHAPEAIKAFADAAACANVPLEIHTEAGCYLLAVRAAAAARVHFKAAQRLEPEAPNHLVSVALTYLIEGRGACALPSLITAGLKSGRTAPLCALMARARGYMAQPDFARKLYDEAVERWGTNPAHAHVRVQAMRACVQMLMDHGDYPRAIFCAQRYLKVVSDATLHLLCATSAYLAGQMTLSCTEALRCIALSPYTIQAWKILYHLPGETPGRPDEVKCLQTICEMEPRTFMYQSSLAHAALRSGQWNEAVAASRCAVALRPLSVKAWQVLAAALRQLERPSDLYVANTYDDANDDVDNNLDVAFSLKEGRDLTIAQQALAALISADACNPMALELLAEIELLLLNRQ